jgi:hypothetical protein
MKEKNNKTSVSKASTLEEVGEFWDTHSLAEYWDQTEEVEFKVRAKRRHRVTIDPDLYAEISISSHKRGILPETLINMWLTEKLKESERTVD